MFRTALAALAFALATPAMAASADVKEQKAEVKAAKKYSKQVDKAVSKWQKGYDKDSAKKMAKADEELDGIINDELRRLRREGIPTVAPAPRTLPEPTRLVDGEKRLLRELAEESAVYRRQWVQHQADTAPPAPEFPTKEAYRDTLVELRELSALADKGKAKPNDLRRMNRLLDELEKKVDGRYERADAKLQRAKG